MKHLSVGSRWNADLIASYHEQWSKDPSSVDGDWRSFFEGFELGLSLPPKPGKGAPAAGSVDAAAQWKVLAAIQAYRMIGHLQARINPLAEPFLTSNSPTRPSVWIPCRLTACSTRAISSAARCSRWARSSPS